LGIFMEEYRQTAEDPAERFHPQIFKSPNPRIFFRFPELGTITGLYIRFLWQRQSCPMTLKTILSTIAVLSGLILSAQNKESVPEFPWSHSIQLNEQALESLFHSPDKISIELGPGFRIEGKIQDKTDHGNAIISLLIRVESSPAGFFSISRYSDPMGRIAYTGRLLKLHDSAGLLLTQKDQHYYFVETAQKFLVAE
jgi:hypothetical protein